MKEIISLANQLYKQKAYNEQHSEDLNFPFCLFTILDTGSFSPYENWSLNFSDLSKFNASI